MTIAEPAEPVATTDGASKPATERRRGARHGMRDHLRKLIVCGERTWIRGTSPIGLPYTVALITCLTDGHPGVSGGGSRCILPLRDEMFQNVK